MPATQYTIEAETLLSSAAGANFLPDVDRRNFALQRKNDSNQNVKLTAERFYNANQNRPLSESYSILPTERDFEENKLYFSLDEDKKLRCTYKSNNTTYAFSAGSNVQLVTPLTSEQLSGLQKPSLLEIIQRASVIACIIDAGYDAAEAEDLYQKLCAGYADQGIANAAVSTFQTKAATEDANLRNSFFAFLYAAGSPQQTDLGFTVAEASQNNQRSLGNIVISYNGKDTPLSAQVTTTPIKFKRVSDQDDNSCLLGTLTYTLTQSTKKDGSFGHFIIVNNPKPTTGNGGALATLFSVTPGDHKAEYDAIRGIFLEQQVHDPSWRMSAKHLMLLCRHAAYHSIPLDLSHLKIDHFAANFLTWVKQEDLQFDQENSEEKVSFKAILDKAILDKAILDKAILVPKQAELLIKYGVNIDNATIVYSYCNASGSSITQPLTLDQAFYNEFLRQYKRLLEQDGDTTGWALNNLEKPGMTLNEKIVKLYEHVAADTKRKNRTTQAFNIAYYNQYKEIMLDDRQAPMILENIAKLEQFSQHLGIHDSYLALRQQEIEQQIAAKTQKFAAALAQAPASGTTGTNGATSSGGSSPTPSTPTATSEQEAGRETLVPSGSSSATKIPFPQPAIDSFNGVNKKSDDTTKAPLEIIHETKGDFDSDATRVDFIASNNALKNYNSEDSSQRNRGKAWLQSNLNISEQTADHIIDGYNQQLISAAKLCLENFSTEFINVLYNGGALCALGVDFTNSTSVIYSKDRFDKITATVISKPYFYPVIPGSVDRVCLSDFGGETEFTYELGKDNKFYLKEANCSDSLLLDLMTGKLNPTKEEAPAIYYKLLKNGLIKSTAKSNQEKFTLLQKTATTLNIPLDLSGVNLSGVNLSGVNLSGVNFKGVNLTGITIDSKTSFSGAQNLLDAIVDENVLITYVMDDGVEAKINLKEFLGRYRHEAQYHLSLPETKVSIDNRVCKDYLFPTKGSVGSLALRELAAVGKTVTIEENQQPASQSRSIHLRSFPATTTLGGKILDANAMKNILTALNTTRSTTEKNIASPARDQALFDMVQKQIAKDLARSKASNEIEKGKLFISLLNRAKQYDIKQLDFSDLDLSGIDFTKTPFNQAMIEKMHFDEKELKKDGPHLSSDMNRLVDILGSAKLENTNLPLKMRWVNHSFDTAETMPTSVYFDTSHQELFAKFQENYHARYKGRLSSPRKYHNYFEAVAHARKYPDGDTAKAVNQTRYTILKTHVNELKNSARSELTKLQQVQFLIAEADRLGVKRDLSGLDLTGCDFSSLDLREVNFKGAILNGCDLSGANVTQADFTGAKMNNVKLSDATQLKGATFTRVTGDVIRFQTRDPNAKYAAVDLPSTSVAELMHHAKNKFDAMQKSKYFDISKKGFLTEINDTEKNPNIPMEKWLRTLQHAQIHAKDASSVTAKAVSEVILEEKRKVTLPARQFWIRANTSGTVDQENEKVCFSYNDYAPNFNSTPLSADARANKYTARIKELNESAQPSDYAVIDTTALRSTQSTQNQNDDQKVTVIGMQRTQSGTSITEQTGIETDTQRTAVFKEIYTTLGQAKTFLFAKILREDATGNDSLDTEKKDIDIKQSVNFVEMLRNQLNEIGIRTLPSVQKDLKDLETFCTWLDKQGGVAALKARFTNQNGAFDTARYDAFITTESRSESKGISFFGKDRGPLKDVPPEFLNAFKTGLLVKETVPTLSKDSSANASAPTVSATTGASQEPEASTSNLGSRRSSSASLNNESTEDAATTTQRPRTP